MDVKPLGLGLLKVGDPIGTRRELDSRIILSPWCLPIDKTGMRRRREPTRLNQRRRNSDVRNLVLLADAQERVRAPGRRRDGLEHARQPWPYDWRRVELACGQVGEEVAHPFNISR